MQIVAALNIKAFCKAYILFYCHVARMSLIAWQGI
jgi:hypothetical protein